MAGAGLVPRPRSVGHSGRLSTPRAPWLCASALCVTSALCVASCAPGADAPALPSGTLFDDRIELSTGAFEVGTGDVFECFYTPLVLDRDLLVTYGTGTQAEGGHHITVYYTTNVRDPEHHPCQESEMATWRQLTAAESSASTEPLHVDGLALRVPAGAQIVLQSHYINVSGPRIVEDRAEVYIPRPEDVREMGGSFVVDDEGLDIPAHSRVRRTYVCTVGTDLQVAMLLGHMHEWGANFRLERLDGAGGAETLYEHAWEALYASHPPTNAYGLDTPLLLPAGTQLRQTCEWNNNEDYPLAFPREMCITYMITFPSAAGDMVFCDPVSSTDETL